MLAYLHPQLHIPTSGDRVVRTYLSRRPFLPYPGVPLRANLYQERRTTCLPLHFKSILTLKQARRYAGLGEL